MPREKLNKSDKKRPSVNSRKSAVQTGKGNRRKQRAGQPRPSMDTDYGTRTISRTSGQGLSITVQIPPLRRPKPQANAAQAKKHPRLQRAILVPAALIVAVLVLFGFNHNPKSTKATPTAMAAAKTAPEYKPLVPSAEKASTTKYDSKRDMVSYETTFSDARITVSQRPLPSGFSKDPNALQRAADSIKATKKLDTARGPIYIVYNETAGDQLAVFADPEVLLFVHANKRMDDASWKSFIELLQAKSWERTRQE